MDDGAQEPQTTKPMDRAEAAGFPPDSGPEEMVMKVSPSLFRGNPVPIVFLAIAPVAATISPAFFNGAGFRTYLIVAGISAALFWGGWFIWWLNFSLARTLEITNKRTIEQRGLLSRSVNEVLHDHVRNIQIDQSFFQRIMGVGRLGISSAGQSGVEIEMKGLPNPDKIRDVIDLYRPL